MLVFFSEIQRCPRLILLKVYPLWEYIIRIDLGLPCLSLSYYILNEVLCLKFLIILFYFEFRIIKTLLIAKQDVRFILLIKLLIFFINFLHSLLIKLKFLWCLLFKFQFFPAFISIASFLESHPKLLDWGSDHNDQIN